MKLYGKFLIRLCFMIIIPVIAYIFFYKVNAIFNNNIENYALKIMKLKQDCQTIL